MTSVEVGRAGPYYYRLRSGDLETEIGFATHAELMAFVGGKLTAFMGEMGDKASPEGTVSDPDAVPAADSLVLVSAGVGPMQPIYACDHCGKILPDPDERTATCSRDAFLTLCPDCYRAAGNTVR